MPRKKIENPDLFAFLSSLAQTRFEQVAEQAKTAFDYPLPPPEDRTYMTKFAEKQRMISAAMRTLKELASHANLRPNETAAVEEGEPEEKPGPSKEAQALLAKARKALSKSKQAE